MESLEQLTKRLRQVDELSQQTHSIISEAESNHFDIPEDNNKTRAKYKTTIDCKEESQQHEPNIPHHQHPSTALTPAPTITEKRNTRNAKPNNTSNLHTPGSVQKPVPRTLSKQFGLSNERRLTKNARFHQQHKPTLGEVQNIYTEMV